MSDLIACRPEEPYTTRKRGMITSRKNAVVATDEQTPRSDADGGWKDIIGEFTEEFFEFYFPDVHAAIDFSVKPNFLDSQLREITLESESGGREADRLIEARLKDGTVE